MKPLNIRFDIKVSARALRLALAGVMLCLAPIDLSSESVTLATYFPAPSGVYTNMITTGGTRLARDGGSAAIGDNITDAATCVPQPACAARLKVMNGYVGIGTTSPVAALEVVGGAGSVATSVNLRVNGRMWTQSGVYVDAPGTLLLGMKSASEVGIQTGGNWRMSVDNTGKVGIGAASPLETLDVAGTIVVRGCAGIGETFYNTAGNCSGGRWCCPAGTYATWVQGLMSNRQNGTGVILNGADGSGSMYCCPCTGGTCPSLP